MTVTVPTSTLPGHPRVSDGPGRTWGLSASVVAAGAALAYLVGRDGSPRWQAARIVVVAATTALVVLVCARGDRPTRGRLAVLAGVPAVAIATGFAPHWAKHGPLLVQASAAVLAAAGLVMVISGTVAVTRAHRWWRRVGTWALVGAATVLAAFIAGVPIAATNVPRAEIDRRPASVGLDAIDVALQTPDGVTLAAWYVPSSNHAAVVLLHGAGSTRSDVLDHAAVLANAGFGVLMVDARGHGESEGRAMDFGWHGDADIAAATSYLQTRPDVDPGRIGAVGMSMGGEEAIGASRSNHLLRAVVAEGAAARTASDEAWLSDEYGLRGAVQEQLERLQDRFTDVLTNASVPTSLRAAVESSGAARYLLITAGDRPDEEHAARHVAAGAPDRVTVWTVAGAGHTDGLVTAPSEWTTRVVRFLDDALTVPRDS